MVRAKENVSDAEIQITSSKNVRSHQETKTKGLLLEDLGAIAVKMRKKLLKTKHVLWLKTSNEVLSEIEFYSDDLSSIDDSELDSEYHRLCKMGTDEQLVPVKARLPIGKSNLLMDLQKMQKNPIFRLLNTLTMDAKSGLYSFKLDELWFTLDVDLLRSKTSGSGRPKHLVLQILWGVVSGTNIDYAELILEKFIQAIKTFFTDASNLKVLPRSPSLMLFHTANSLS
ncbi:hypothetical protein Tco_0499850 [Tanacetum coccineum]